MAPSPRSPRRWPLDALRQACLREQRSLATRRRATGNPCAWTATSPPGPGNHANPEPARALDARIVSLTEIMARSSHDLNNQLTVLVGLLTLLDADVGRLAEIIGETRSASLRTDLAAIALAVAGVRQVSRDLAAASLDEAP